MTNRPGSRQSEHDVDRLVGPDGVIDSNYRPQVSFRFGEKHGGRGSSRPDGYRLDDSLEVKNYDLSTTKGRYNLVYRLAKQAEAREENLPKGTRQTVFLDLRGQELSQADRDALRARIEAKGALLN
jgi:toxin YqcG